jgi:proteasome accessory factor A
MGHVEYCTAECLNLADLVASDDAGERLLQQALDELGLSSEACFVKNNVDHYTGATFGCHENYLVSRDGPFNQRNLGGLLSFLALRGLMVGAGRVGGLSHTGRRSGRGSGKDSVPFQIMQRAD